MARRLRPNARRPLTAAATAATIAVTLQALTLVLGTSTVWAVGRFGPNDISDGFPAIEATGPLPP